MRTYRSNRLNLDVDAVPAEPQDAPPPAETFTMPEGQSLDIVCEPEIVEGPDEEALRYERTRERLEPFPTEVLPEALRDYIVSNAESMRVEEGMIALPVITVAAGLVGAARYVQVDDAGWREPCVLWSGVVARSGSMKSPAFGAAGAPVKEFEIALQKLNAERRKLYEKEMARYRRDMKAFERSKGGDPGTEAPREPDRPPELACYQDDVTPEALVVALQDNPRGQLMLNEELGTFFGSFGRYKSKGDGGESAAYLALYDATTFKASRKTGDNRVIFAPNAATSVAGTIQPSVLSAQFAKHSDSGMLARFAWYKSEGPTRAPEDDDGLLSEAEQKKRAIIRQRYMAVMLELARVGLYEGEEGSTLRMTPEGTRAINGFRRELEQEGAFVDEHLAAALAKVAGRAARIALVTRLVRQAQERMDFHMSGAKAEHANQAVFERRGSTSIVLPPNSPLVDPITRMAASSSRSTGAFHAVPRVELEDVEAAISICKALNSHLRAIYGELGDDRDEWAEERDQVIELMHRHGGSITVRDLMRSSRRYKNSADHTHAVLDALVDQGVARWQTETSANGKSIHRAVLIDCPDEDAEG